ncbi:transglutaminase-like domain-containing protein [Desulfurococcus sp.]|uniref:transglutaminase-like domain-containing protein n=1 Tax=Desulfurococcus sp. TaxID=51678 RepID=UPI003164F32B
MNGWRTGLLSIVLSLIIAYVIGSLYPLPIVGMSRGNPVPTITETSTRTVTETSTVTTTLTSEIYRTTTVTTTLSQTVTSRTMVTITSTTTIIETRELTSLELVIPSFRLVDGGGELMLAGRYLVLRYTSWRPVLIMVDAVNNANYFYLTPFQVTVPVVYARLLEYDGLYYTEIYDVAEVADMISSRGLSRPVLLFKALNDWACDIASSISAINITGCRATPIKVEAGIGTTIIEAVVKYVNTSSIQYISHLLYNDSQPRDLGNASWMVLQWLEEYTSYDYVKAGSNHGYIYDPITFANIRRGICTDYALFTATALINLSRSVYILVFNTTNVGHATAGVVIGGGFFILDQKLPPIELEDYFSNLDSIIGGVLVGDIFLHEVWIENNTVKLLMIRTSLEDLLRKYPDTNPLDDITPGFINELINVLGETYKYDPGAKPTGYLEVNWGGFKYYSDIFAHEYAVYVANRLAGTLGASIVITGVDEPKPYTIRVYYQG